MSSPFAGLGAGVGIGVGYGVLSEYARLGIMIAKWRGVPESDRKGCIAKALQSILSAEKNTVSGLSSKGAVDAIFRFIDSTLEFALQIDEGIATQMFVQMIQQSIAYAIHSSHAGSIGTIGNVYSGSMYLSGAESSNIGESAEFTSRGLRGFLSAEVGQNIPTVAFNLVRGANRRIDDVYRSILRQTDSLLDEWNDLTLSYYRHYHSMCRERFADAIKMKETATDRAYGLLEQIANEHLARIVEQIDTLEGAKSWFDGGFLSADELKEIALRLDLEVQASISDYEAHKTAVLDAIDTAVEEWDMKVDQALGDLTDSEYRFCLLIRQILDEVFMDVVDFVKQLVETCDNSVKDVCAYRNITPSVNIVEHDPVAVVEVSPDVEVSRIYARHWKDIPPIIVRYEFQQPDGVLWEEVEYVPVVEEATELPYRAIEEVDFSVVAYTYDKIHTVGWSDVGGC